MGESKELKLPKEQLYTKVSMWCVGTETGLVMCVVKV